MSVKVSTVNHHGTTHIIECIGMADQVSFAEDFMADRLDLRKPVKRSADSLVSRLTSDARRASWLGRTIPAKTPLDVLRAGLEPWKDGLEAIQAVASRITESVPEPVSRRRTGCWADEGDTFDLDRFFEGLPSWRGTRRAMRSGPQDIHIMCQVNASSSTSAESMFWRGGATVALTDLLESAGYRVGITSLSYTENAFLGGDNLLQVCHLKSPGDPIDRAGLAAGLSPWLRRTMGFFMYHAANMVPTRGYGRALATPDALLAGYTNDGSLTINLLDFLTFDRALKAASSALKNLSEAAELALS